MSVPETAVDEDRRSVFAHNDVRLAGHALDIEPVAVSVRPQPFPNQYLRLGRLAAYMRHAAVALGRCQDIGHKLFELLRLLFERFDSLQICLFYGRKGVVEPVGISDKSLCVEWLFGISELPHFRQVLQYVSFVRIIFVHIIYILRFLLFLSVHQFAPCGEPR